MKLQGPRGTRDFYPEAMAWRRRLEDAWRTVSVRHGFEEVDGPIFETQELYKIKSGDGILSEIFHVRHPQGDAEFAIRPEFTPTLARMVAARANGLPKPIKWFATPNFCRAERPQRGRLREFWQWNVDIIGAEGALADAECILVAVDLLREFGMTSQHVVVRISHREVVRQILLRLGVAEEKLTEAFELLDRREKMEHDAFVESATLLGLDGAKVERFLQMCRRRYPVGEIDHLARSIGMEEGFESLRELEEQLIGFGIGDWCAYDLGIVRGLAYYTGTVFELHEASGMERAVAGGGRYDKLIELFGGPKMSAVGFGMGDVVLTNVLQDKGLLPEDVTPQPDVFVLASSEAGAGSLRRVIADLREAGVHARFSYKSTTNVGKLLKEANQSRARFALLLGDAVSDGEGELKDLDTGDQQVVKLAGVADRLSV
ncbi:histidine--tRNA ligase [Mucisphaera calidilacus]|uniref:Histidine--tRNA ligase n=1 Tax=Mucisphaera calidilacus TaxID=2527982 RepID=A0A518BYD7_9BACT|nr:histidine--tRNA ligase [Mucisphaera calidilacus]QDU71985.1 Histidine--tRNA ligase [Mucisphaera calidilacus]